MSEPTTPTSASSPSTRSTFQRARAGHRRCSLLGLAVFLVRLQHDAPTRCPAAAISSAVWGRSCSAGCSC
ncbi:MAG: hypothetical protein R3E53_21790 [Myxococcota bacterium]